MTLPAPVLKRVSFDGKVVSIEVEPVSGATGYDARLTSSSGKSNHATSAEPTFEIPLTVTPRETWSASVAAQSPRSSGYYSTPRELITATTSISLLFFFDNELSANWQEADGAQNYYFGYIYYSSTGGTIVPLASTSQLVAGTNTTMEVNSSFLPLTAFVGVASSDGIVYGPPSAPLAIITQPPVVQEVSYTAGVLNVIASAANINALAIRLVLGYHFSNQTVSLPQATTPPTPAQLIIDLEPGDYQVFIAGANSYSSGQSQGPYATAFPLTVGPTQSDGDAPFWPMYQNNPQRTGADAGTLLAHYAAGDSVAAGATLAGAVVIDASGNLYVCDTSSQGKVYCIELPDQLLWSYATGQTLSSRGALIDNDGTIYVAGSSLFALTPGATSATLLFSLNLGSGLSCSAPLAISPDGTTIYVLVNSNASTPVSSIVAVTLPTATIPAAIAWTTALVPTTGSATTSHSGPAVSPGGTIYVGDDAGNLYAISSTGALVWLKNFNQPLTTPAIGTTLYLGVPYLTVHVMSINPVGNVGILYALVAPLGITFRYAPYGSVAVNTLAAPSISAEGNIYAGFNTIYQLSFSAVEGHTKNWSASTTDSGVQPGPIAVDQLGSVVFCGTDNYLAAYSANGELLWTTAMTTGGGSPSLNADGSVIYIDGSSVVSTDPSGNPALAEAFEALTDNAVITNSQNVYPLNATTFPDGGVFGLIQNALGASPTSLTGTVIWNRITLELIGTTNFYSAGNVNVILRLSSKQVSGAEVIELHGEFSFTSLDLSDAFPSLADTVFDGLAIQNAVLRQHSSTANPSAGWRLHSGTIGLGGPLTNTAELLYSPPSTLSVIGDIEFGDAWPIVTIGAVASPSLQMKLGGVWTLPVELHINAGWDDEVQAFVASVKLTTKVQIGTGGPMATLIAHVPPVSGPAVFAASFSSPLSVSSVAQLIWWSGGNATALAAALPSGVASQQFQLEFVRLTVAPSRKAALAVSARFTTGSYTLFSVSSPGVSLSLSNVAVEFSVINPLSQTPSYHVTLTGEVTIAGITFTVVVEGPDWQIFGIARSSTSVLPATAIAALGSDISLPASAPTNNVSYVSFSAYPAFGTYFFSLVSPASWTLFTAGSFTATVSDVTFVVSRTIADPVTRSGMISLQATGTVTLAGIPIQVGGYISETGRCVLKAVFPNGVSLPTLSDVIKAVSSGYNTSSLPPAIANLGKNIELAGLELILASGSGISSLNVAIGTVKGWAGWSILTSPFTFSLSWAELRLYVTSGSQTVQAVVRGAFRFGSGNAGIMVQLPLPYNSASMVFSLVDEDTDLPLPTVGDFVGLFSTSWKDALPAGISSLGSGIVVETFMLTITQASSQTTVSASFALTAADLFAEWSPLHVSGFSLSRLRLAVSYMSGTISGSISGVLTVGSIPIALIAQMSNQSTFSFGLAEGSVALPSLGTLISLFSEAWSNALPTAITSISSVIEKFSISRGDTSSGATVKLTSQNLSFSLFNVISLSSLSAELGYFDFHRYFYSGFSGSLDLTGTIFNQPITVKASMPDATFTATVKLTGFTMGALVEEVLGPDTDVPDWLNAIAVTELAVTASTTPQAMTLAGKLADIKLGANVGTFSNVRLSVAFSETAATTVCLMVQWTSPKGASAAGTVCYPFLDLSIEGIESVIENFADGIPLHLQNPFAGLVDDVDADIYLMFGYVIEQLARRRLGTTQEEDATPPTPTLEDLELAFLINIYNNDADGGACVAGVVDYFDNAPSSSDLVLIAQALMSTLGLSTIDELEAAFSQGLAFQNVSIPQSELLAAIAQATNLPVIESFVVSVSSNPLITKLKLGNPATLSWSAENYSSLGLSGPGLKYSPVNVTKYSSFKVYPTAGAIYPLGQVTYTLTAYGENYKQSAQVEITIGWAAIYSFYSKYNDPSNPLTYGKQATLYWNAPYAQSVYLFSSNLAKTNVSGTSSFFPISPKTTTSYYLYAYGYPESYYKPGHPAQRSTTVYVEPATPVISSFTSSNPSTSKLTLGKQATLYWTAKNYSSLYLSGGGLTSQVKVTGSSYNVTPTKNATYILTAKDSQGSQTTASTTVELGVPTATIYSAYNSDAPLPYGQLATLKWTVQYAESLYVKGPYLKKTNVTGYQSNSIQVNPSKYAQTKNLYHLYAYGYLYPQSNGIPVKAQTTMYIQPAGVILSFGPNPSSHTHYQPSLQWSTQYASKCFLQGPHYDYIQVDLNDSDYKLINVSFGAKYTLTCVGYNGSKATKTITW